MSEARFAENAPAPAVTRKAAARQAQGHWYNPLYPAVMQFILDGHGLPEKPVRPAIRLAVYMVIWNAANEHEDLRCSISLEQIMQTARVSKPTASRAIQELKQLGVLHYKPGAQHIHNLYAPCLPCEIPALRQKPLPAPPHSQETRSKIDLPLEPVASPDEPARSKPDLPSEVKSFSARGKTILPKQQECDSEICKSNNNSARAQDLPETTNVVVASLVSIGFQEHDAQAAFGKYDSTVILKAVKNTKARMQRGTINSAAWCHDQIKRLQAEHVRALHNAPVAVTARSETNVPQEPPRPALTPRAPSVPPTPPASPPAAAPLATSGHEVEAPASTPQETASLNGLRAMRQKLNAEGKASHASYHDRAPQEVTPDPQPSRPGRTSRRAADCADRDHSEKSTPVPTSAPRPPDALTNLPSASLPPNRAAPGVAVALETWLPASVLAALVPPGS